MLKKTSKLLTILLVIFLTACRTTIPMLTPLSLPSDQYLTCDEIINEIDLMDNTVDRQKKNLTEQITANIALAAVGLYVFHVAAGLYYFLVPIPFMFMDITDGVRSEAKSSMDRYLALQDLYDKKWCSIRN